MENSRGTDIGIQLYNLIQNRSVITWDELLKVMGSIFDRNRDEIFEGMNKLINDGKIVLPQPDVYCLPSTLKKLKKAEEEEWKRRYPNGQKMSREQFDQMTPQQKVDFVNSGGLIG
jgi:hypothetical protein